MGPGVLDSIAPSVDADRLGASEAARGVALHSESTSRRPQLEGQSHER